MNDPIAPTHESNPRRAFLMVEDDAALRAAMTRALTRAGYEVVPVATGSQVERAPAVAPSVDIRTCSCRTPVGPESCASCADVRNSATCHSSS